MPYRHWIVLLALPIATASCRDVPDNLLWPQSGDPDCIDADGDGFGEGCSLGEDCNDASPALIHLADCVLCETERRVGCACQPGVDGNEEYYTGPDGTVGKGVCAPGLLTCLERQWAILEPEHGPSAGEICGNGIDDDCDDEVDENLFECADCDPSCHSGGGGDGIWNDDPGNREGLEETDDGGITLQDERYTFSYAWIANDGEATVSKFNTSTGVEEGRYRSGLASVIANRPSRTAVDRIGDVYIANRAFGEQGSVTKIAGVPDRCVDRNADAVIQTSTGPADVLTYDTDECVLWTVPLSGVDAIPRALAIDVGDEETPEGYPWIGTFMDREEGSTRHGRAFKLRPSDGAVLASVALPTQPYGAIADGAHRIWFASYGEDALAYVSTADDTASGAIAKAEAFGCNQTYGVAVDDDGRVWTGGWSCECAYRYDPADGAWTTIDLRGRGNTRGVTPDGEGNIWVAHSTDPGTVTRIPIDVAGPVVAADQTELVTLQGDASGTVGVGADFERHLWIVNRDSSTVTRMNLGDRTQQVYESGLAPYTYSDFTGFQLSRIVTPQGHYDQEFEGCEPGNVEDPNITEWGDLTWEADVPDSTFLQFVVRTADTQVGLDSAADVIVATVPDAVPPANVGAALEAAGVAPGRYLRVTVRFVSQDGSSRPVLYRLNLTWICPDVIG